MGLSASKTTRTSRILLYIVLGWTLLTAILWLLDFVLRYGMSTASWDEVSQSVCCLNAGTTPLGTGVFVSDKFPGAIPERRIFLLTARHVAEASHKTLSLQLRHTCPNPERQLSAPDAVLHDPRRCPTLDVPDISCRPCHPRHVGNMG